MADIGKFNTLPVIALTENGAYLNADQLGEILLPNRYIPNECEVGDLLTVFIYLDSADRLVATTQKPYAQVDEFASLKVVQVNKMGAFLDWGLPKDLLVPYNQQHKAMEVGRHYLVRISLDNNSQRLIASSKIDKFVDIWPADYKAQDKVDLLIAAKTDLGFKAIINDKHWGLLYDNEIFQPLRVGQKVCGYIKQVREDERIDLTLTRTGNDKVNDFSGQLIAYLSKQGGHSTLNDKSSPELIKKELGVSKKTFKATVGNLLKQGKLTIEPNGIKLT
ncbi:CvfB family protein [Thalassotalea profundi]|uniref:GntR family transcriptional regulator n=1 Tax=Thalassotalea profundi TaxID=2036687 RepID=A0ABQ3IZD3_9GAMM|nr:S1-like domain-containing RNA-binding protein [Thalassotalea profundi]GHE99284.1 GntR family transcriptional regulator [Thalassotalea profundi]